MFLINRRALAVIGAAAAAIGTTGFLATPAQAASVGVARVVGTNAVYFQAAAGQANTLSISVSGRTTILDDVVAIQAGAGCKAVSGDRTKVTCTTSAGTAGYNVQLGDKNDSLYNRTSLYLMANGADGDDKLYGGSGRDVVYGGNGIDVLSTGNGNDALSGGGSNDTLYGGAGDDLIYGGLGADRVYGGAGDDTVQAEAGDDFVWGEAGWDEIYGGEGIDSIAGGTEVDFVEGGNGNDKIWGGSGEFYDVDLGWFGDVLDGNGGNDTVSGEDGIDLVLGGAGNDMLGGQNGNDEIQGGDGADQMWGQAGDDDLWGEGGDDRLSGNEGDDYLIGEDFAGGEPVGNPAALDVADGGAHLYEDVCFVMTAANATSTCEIVITPTSGALSAEPGKGKAAAPADQDARVAAVKELLTSRN
ncbi:calcium-binding protein [Actinoplanes utahensis]|uniref:calcium-binding protein n=1 Tax=Actinoplanes utahensis TaxID=1869 RepID=UPI000691B8DF|nr:calcium-binding protein [Actinoplanes utahensis]GIF31016.1 hypothetical protein Aut01nite_40020 [Actinoplanes utahensis]